MSFVMPQKVLFKHCDPAGIVFYPRYFEMINDCVECFFDEVLGTPFEKIMPEAGIPTAEITVKFQAPSRHGDQLALMLSPVRLGQSSFALAIIATCGEQTRFAAQSTLVYVNHSGRATAWPPSLQKPLEQFTGENT